MLPISLFWLAISTFHMQQVFMKMKIQISCCPNTLNWIQWCFCEWYYAAWICQVNNIRNSNYLALKFLYAIKLYNLRICTFFGNGTMIVLPSSICISTVIVVLNSTAQMSMSSVCFQTKCTAKESNFCFGPHEPKSNYRNHFTNILQYQNSFWC